MCGFCNVWLCVCVGFVMCGCFDNMCTCIYSVFVLFRLLHLFLFVTSVRTTDTVGNSIAVNNNNIIIIIIIIIPPPLENRVVSEIMWNNTVEQHRPHII